MIDRRTFAKVTGLAVAAGAVTSATGATAPSRTLVKPKRLQPGDTVGMVLPASMSFEVENVDRGREQLEALGFKVKVGANARARNAYLAGTDRQRADDINAMFADTEVDGISCFTGGWGTPRLLPYLDYEMIRKNPKVIIGFSDVTGLINAIHKRTGLVTFHGPMADSRYEPYTLANFRRVVMTAEPIGVLANPPKKEEELTDRENRMVTLHGGTATGPLIGGNLSLVAATMGTPYEIDTTGAILFLEDTHEELYRIDRMLTQLWLGGKLDRIAGFVFGRCTDCPIKGPSFSLGELLRERFSHVPALWNLSFGHIEKKLTLPIGIPATLDADAMTLTIAESAVL
jgi:muramoyltetrapeptide carboxypeptidase